MQPPQTNGSIYVEVPFLHVESVGRTLLMFSPALCHALRIYLYSDTSSHSSSTRGGDSVNALLVYDSKQFSDAIIALTGRFYYVNLSRQFEP